MRMETWSSDKEAGLLGGILAWEIGIHIPILQGLPSETGWPEGLFRTGYKKVNLAEPKGGNMCVCSFFVKTYFMCIIKILGHP